MANSYTVTPGLVIGDQRVTGNLTVEGSTFQLGSLARKFRIQELALGEFESSVNVDRIAAAQDDPAIASLVFAMIASARQYAFQTQAAGFPAGGQFDLISNSNNFALARKLLAANPTFQLGAGTRKLRIQEIADGDYRLTVNLDEITDTQDDPGQNSVGIQLLDALRWLQIFSQAAGTPAADLTHLISRPESIKAFGLPLVAQLFADFANVTRSDAQTNQVISSFTLPAGIRPAGRVLLLELYGDVTWANGTITIRVRHDGQDLMGTLIFPASDDFRIRILWGRAPATPGETSAMRWRGSTLFVNPVEIPLTSDDSVDRTLDVTYTSGFAGNSVTLRGWTMRAISLGA